MDITTNWPQIKKLFNASFRSSFHFAIASVGPEGAPHVTPIGSLMLGRPGHGFYFEEFTRRLPQNLQGDRRVCVLAVNSSRWFWIRSLIRGRFVEPPAVRLYGIAGDTREASDEEIALWQRRVRRASFSKGHGILWASMIRVRDIRITGVEPVHLGEMTRKLW